MITLTQLQGTDISPAIIEAARRVGYRIVGSMVPGYYDLLAEDGSLAAAGVSAFNLELSAQEWRKVLGD